MEDGREPSGLVTLARRIATAAAFVSIAAGLPPTSAGADSPSSVLPPESSSTRARSPGIDLSKLSLEQLSQIEVSVTSVAKHSEKISESPAAITVISRDDIRRSGATSLPDALRLAPGVEVAQIDSSRYAISIRGFNSSASNKLLVLIDGRIVYNPLFALTYWNGQDVMLEDIDRIEVIRGPGATLWGSNAVNGVINITTRSARETQGDLLAGLTGKHENNTVSFRHGGHDGKLFYRVYGKTFRRDAFTTIEGADAVDDWRVGRGGFRTDWSQGKRDKFTVQGDYYNGNAGQVSTTTPTGADRELYSGTNLLGRWTRTYSPTRSFSVLTYYDRTDRSSSALGEVRENYDLEVQQNSSPARRHSLVMGMSARRSADWISQPSTLLAFNPQTAAKNVFSVFAQDEIELSPDKFRLTLGTKLEHNDFSGWEIQPTVRSVLRTTPRQTLWTAVSRAVRIPTRVDEDLLISITTPKVIPVVTNFTGNKNFKSEVETSYELGYRVQAPHNVSFDLATFYVDYTHLETTEAFPPFLDIGPPKRFILGFTFDNKGVGGAHGAELAANWSVNDRWKLAGSYTNLQIHLRKLAESTAPTDPSPGESPANQFQIRSFLNVKSNVELDSLLYFVNAATVPDYFRFDQRLGWHPRRDLELSVVAQNLLTGHHQEFAGTSSTVIVPSTFAKLVWSF